jgi:methionyl aminopeptidase
MNKGIFIKSPEEIKYMAEGGKRLGKVKKALRDKVREGVSAREVEDLADTLIKKEGGTASFKMVPGYNWATCVNINDGVVHGIPKSEIVFKEGDVVSVDVGMFYKGFHTDTSFSVVVGQDRSKQDFLDIGEKALDVAIGKAQAGKRIYDISEAIENTLNSKGYSPVRALVGHGVGRELHEEPQIPCFVNGDRKTSPIIPEGAVLAIEVMYAKGSGDVKLEPDGWTISSSDDTITGLFEETVAVTNNGPIVLTR